MILPDELEFNKQLQLAILNIVFFYFLYTKYQDLMELLIHKLYLLVQVKVTCNIPIIYLNFK